MSNWTIPRKICNQMNKSGSSRNMHQPKKIKYPSSKHSTPSVPKYKNVFNTTLVSKTFLYYGTEGVRERKRETTVFHERKNSYCVFVRYSGRTSNAQRKVDSCWKDIWIVKLSHHNMRTYILHKFTPLLLFLYDSIFSTCKCCFGTVPPPSTVPNNISGLS